MSGMVERIVDRCEADANSGCWLWTGAVTDKGYGRMNVAGKNRHVHRLMWTEVNGSPGVLHVCHRCDTPACCNPSHMFLGTHAENMQDMWNKGRHRPLVKKGDRIGVLNPNAKLTDDKVRWARDQVTKGRKVSDVAAELRVDRSTLSCVITGRAWKHV